MLYSSMAGGTLDTIYTSPFFSAAYDSRNWTILYDSLYSMEVVYYVTLVGRGFPYSV